MKIEELDEHRAAAILTWLSQTDAEFAQAKGAVEAAELTCKRVLARLFIAADGNNEERRAEAEVDEHTQAADDAYIAARVKFETLKAKRERAETWWDMWRSLEASRRRVIV